MGGVFFTLSMLALILFMPVQLGGGTSYVIISGSSMEPGFHMGDLIIVRRADNYQVGDEVVYRHPNIGAVFHRIVDREGDEYVFKGDNNGWLDNYQPIKEELIGRLWIHIPKLGRLFNFLRNPFIFATLVMFSIGLVFMNARNQTKQMKSKPRGSSQRLLLEGEGLTEALFVFSVLVFASFILAFVSFSREPKITVTDNYVYTNNGAFYYTGQGHPGIYDNPTIEPGEPIFFSITDEFMVSFVYQFQSNHAYHVNGVYDFELVISDNSGWNRHLVLQEEQPFTDGEFSLNSTVRIKDITDITSEYETVTGIANAGYNVALVANYTITGTLAGQPLEETSSSSLNFVMTPLYLYLNQRVEGDQLLSVQPHTLEVERQEANTIRMLNMSIPVVTARIISVMGVLIFFLADFLILRRVNKASQDDVAAHNRMMYGSWIVDIVCNTDVINQSKAIHLDKMESLVKIAERGQTLVMHCQHDNKHHYFVRFNDLNYLYVTEETPSEIMAGNPQLEETFNWRRIPEDGISRSVAVQPGVRQKESEPKKGLFGRKK